MQFLEDCRYVAVVVDGKTRLYSRHIAGKEQMGRPVCALAGRPKSAVGKIPSADYLSQLSGNHLINGRFVFLLF